MEITLYILSMINLLPPEQKAHLLWDRRRKIVVILCFFLLLFVTSLSLVLFSIRLQIQTQVTVQKILIEQKRDRDEGSEATAIEESIQELNRTVGALLAFYRKQIPLTNTLERISGMLPVATRLDNLTVFPASTSEGTGVKITLAGFMPTRETVFALKQNFDREKDLQDVSFPPSNWVNPIDINFFVTFGIPLPAK